jgi:ubiquinone/menaquinone biosynthesis C-methylase UbiE
MEIYDDFAYVYAKGQYTDFSRQMAEVLPSVLKHLHAKPRRILDLACGEGTFAVHMAEKGFDVTGVDRSPRMLELARIRAEKSKAEARFMLGDMRSLEFREQFDLVTCWFDSLNYLLDSADLKKTFLGVSEALKPEGLFIFDMNTTYGLAVNWRESPCYVEGDTPDVFETHRQEFDFEHNIATMRITCFIRGESGWMRVDEEHRERAYSQEEIRSFLDETGFQLLATWGNFREMSDPKPDSGRLWYITKKR